jgi:flavin-dependent dehydrogenase
MANAQYDVLVVGAGPAGATMANRLADFGYRIALIEKATFPRPHIGLSLTSGIHHWLKMLNIEKQVDQLHCKRALKSTVLWSTNEPLIKTFEKETAGFHLDRGAFDALLVNECRQKGVEIIQPGLLKSLTQRQSGQWDATVSFENKEQQLSSTFIVEATGRKSIIKTKKIAYQPKLVATFAYWELKPLKKESSFIEAGQDCWFWGAPINDTHFVLCVFSDPSKVKEATSVTEFYTKVISQSTFSTDILNNGTQGEITVCDATPYYDSNVISEHFIKIGDAAYTMDPISSQGVQKAIKSGVQGAIVVNSILKKNKASIAISYYKNLIAAEVKKNKRWSSDFYNEQSLFRNSPFWESRKKVTQPSISNERISLRKDTILELNKKGDFLMVPILESDEVTELEGFVIEGHDEPYVFIETIHIVPLLKAMHLKTLQECIKMTSESVKNQNPIKLMEWLLYQGVLEVS